jgi:RND family efflux transporter MFP subunit
MKLAIRIVLVILGIVILAAVMGLLAGHFNEKIEPGTVAPSLPPAGGEAVAAATIEEPLVEQATGTIRAKEETAISSRIMATILSVRVRAGDSVQEGDVLVTLDSRDLDARVQQARQALEAVEAQEREAQLQLQRTEELVKSGAAPQAQRDRDLAASQALKADVSRARQALGEAEANLTYATITAPISGRVVERYAEPGDTAAPGQTLVRLYDPASLRLEANVRESLATKLQRGQELRVRIDALEQEFPATVEEIVPQSQAGSRSFVVKAAIPATENLYPGMFGRLLIPKGTANRLLIPANAVARVGQLDYVVVKENGKIARRFVRGTVTPDGQFEVLSGLRPGESVVVEAE